MSAAASVALTRSNAAPKAASPTPAAQTRSPPNAGAMMSVATPAVSLKPANQQSNIVQGSPSLSAAPIPAAPARSSGIQAVLDKFADWSNNIPGFRMLTIVLGFNPINFRAASRNAPNLLRALIELIPGGAVITQALDNHGAINQAGAWVGQKIAALGDIGGEIVGGLNRFIDTLKLSDLAPWNWGDVWERAKQIFTTPIARLIAFGAGVVTDILKIVKQLILKPLAALAKDTKGYDLLKAILGEDPITGDKVPRNAETLIGGFMKFIGQEEIWQNIKKGNAVGRAWIWFQGALKDLMGMVHAVPQKIVATLSSLTFQDIITVAGAFIKVAGVFVSIAGDFLIWGLKTSWSLLEIIFDVVKPGIMVYIKKTGAALKSIIKNPLPFVGNLVKAAKLGFQNFADNFGGHLKAGLIDWLTGSLEGVYIPTALSLPEMGKFAMSVLGITWAQIRGKIVKALGPTGETIMKGLETGFDIVVALVTGGPAAAWELIKEKLTDLKDQVVSGIVSFVTDTVIKKAVPKLISMFIPGAGFISAIISIYDTVMVFVEKIAKIIEVVTAFIDSIVTIAGGNITAAANRVEKILGGLLSLAISFLAGFLGLGKITDKIMGVIEKVRASVDKALDKAIEWIVVKARNLVSRLFGGDPNASPADRLEQGLREGQQAVNRLSGSRIGIALIKPVLAAIKIRNNMRSLEAQPDGEHWAVVGEVNPRGKKLTQKLVESGTSAGKFSSKITYFPVNDLGFGKKMLADPVGPDHPVGTTVSQTLRLELREDRGTRLSLGSIAARQGKYRLGHLLNHHLGGPGNDWRNLTPISPSANASHLHDVEKNIKILVDPPHKRWVWYQVVADYSGQAPAPPSGSNVNQLETQFARYLRWSYQLKKEDSKSKKLVDDTQPVAGIKASDSNKVENIVNGYP